MRARRTLLLGSTFAGTCLAALALWVAPAGAFGVSSSPCSLISKARIEKSLGLDHVKETAMVGQQSSTDGGVVASACKNVTAWSGSTPTTAKQLTTKVANGTAARMDILTSVADSSATNASQWVSSGFQTQMSTVLSDCHVYKHLSHGHYVALPRDGAESSGGQTDAIGPLSETCGVWSRSDTHRIIFIVFEASRRSPSVRDFKKIANAAVPRFW